MNSIDNANKAPRCEHIKFDGIRCAAPALRGHDRCRFHFGLGNSHAAFPIIEDGLSLQVALNQVARHILKGYLDRKTATTLLYCFQIMATNFKQINAERKLVQKQQDDDDLPGPSLAEILLDRLRQLEEEPADGKEENPEPAFVAASPGPPSSIVNRQSAMPFVAARSTGVSPVAPNPTPVIPSAAEGPSVSPSAQSSIDNRQSAKPSGPRPDVSSVVNPGVIDTLHACAQSSIDNRQSEMPFGARPDASALQSAVTRPFTRLFTA
jgi:hypothetical protein